MDSQTFKRCLNERISEIDQALSQYRDLALEREELQRTLDFYEAARGKPSLFSVPLPSESAAAQLSHLRRFQPRPDSKTSRIVELTRTILERTPGNAAPFTSIVKMLPPDVLGTGQHAHEGARTAIKRAGNRVGIRYSEGGVVRLNTKSPQAETA